MPAPIPEQVEPRLACDLCGQNFRTPGAAVQRGLNLCPACAYEQAHTFLMGARTRGKGGRWLSLALVVVTLAFLVGGGVWLLKNSGLADLRERLLQRVSNSVPADAPVSDSPAPSPVVETAPPKEVVPQWIQRVFTDTRRRSVSDAGHVHLLYVTAAGTDSRRGLASRLFITCEAPSDEGAKLVTEVGEHMKISFDEALRYVRKLPREWERDFSIRLSFEDKFVSKDGGSAGTGFTVAMLAAIQGAALDPEVAITGDLTVDGSVQPVGGVVEKLRGAIESKCKVTLIPERNAREAAHLALLDGTPLLWETQILSIHSVEQASQLARRERPEAVKSALARFTALRARLPATVTANYLQSPIVQTELREVLRQAPNHLSAATLLNAAANQLPRELSLNRSVEEILVTAHLFVSSVINPSEATPRSSQGPGLTVFPEREYNECLRALQRLTPILDRRSLELKQMCVAYASAVRAGWTYQPSDPAARRSPQERGLWMQRERQAQQQIKESVEEARSLLLLALRKLDTDGSLKSEMNRR